LPIVAEVGGPDVALLAELAKIGGGKAFLAHDPAALRSVFAAIDALETSALSGEVLTRYHEHYAPWVAGALVALGFFVMSRSYILVRYP
jgi:hypothetical protein